MRGIPSLVACALCLASTPCWGAGLLKSGKAVHSRQYIELEFALDRDLRNGDGARKIETTLIEVSDVFRVFSVQNRAVCGIVVVWNRDVRKRHYQPFYVSDLQERYGNALGSGHIGLRQMWGTTGRHRDFQVWDVEE